MFSAAHSTASAIVASIDLALDDLKIGEAHEAFDARSDQVEMRWMMIIGVHVDPRGMLQLANERQSQHPSSIIMLHDVQYQAVNVQGHRI